MGIGIDDVQRIAQLAKLALAPAEAEVIATQLAGLVSHFEALEALDLENVQATAHVMPLACPEREDSVVPSLAREIFLEQAPQREDEYFMVPAIIE